MNGLKTSRRSFMASCGVLGATALLTPAMGMQLPTDVRKYNLSISPVADEPNPEMIEVIRNAGMSDVWITASWYGELTSSIDKLKLWRSRIESAGMRAHFLTVPLGHPGCKAPSTWHLATAVDGTQWVGTSLHAPATKANCNVLKQISAIGGKRVFLDDDFRLAPSPGGIGGCFCPEHKQAFLLRCGYNESKWQDLLDAVVHRKLTPVLQAWVEFTCDQLSTCFSTQQEAVPNIQLGIMVMYLGSEKAGIRLTDYHDLPMRVGECMFNDKSFTPIKGKTDELFSSLFHRRFVQPELAYSETTAYPDKQLSLKNKIAKLAVSTLSDVRNTMFMCDFPKEHWESIAPAMKHHAKIHSKIAGHVARGPLKHFWGKASRFVGDDNPYSLFLALGVPFEVTESPAADGFTFLSDADAADSLQSQGTTFVMRPGAATLDNVRSVPESLPSLYAFKQKLLPQLEHVPYVEGELPVVCAWYPTARAVVLWNLSEQQIKLTLRHGEKRRAIVVDGLDVALAEDVDV